MDVYLVRHFCGLFVADFLSGFCPEHWYNIFVKGRVVLHIADIQRSGVDFTLYESTVHDRVDLEPNHCTKGTSAERLNVHLSVNAVKFNSKKI